MSLFKQAAQVWITLRLKLLTVFVFNKFQFLQKFYELHRTDQNLPILSARVTGSESSKYMKARGIADRESRQKPQRDTHTN